MLNLIRLVAVLIILQSFVLNSETACSNIIDKTQWGGTAVHNPKLRIRPPQFVIAHHTTGPTCSNQYEFSQTVKRIQQYHIKAKKWRDIGYNFLISNNGNVYAGRGWNVQGAHTLGYNTQSIGIAFIGKYSNQLPSHAALNALKDLIACGVEENYLRKSYSLIGHRQASQTECPGNKLFNILKGWPHFKSNPTPL